MNAKTPNSGLQPTAIGVQASASIYGATIPTVYGLTRLQMLLIWLQNIRSVTSGSKQKKGSQNNYFANADFLIASNPILNILQCWLDNNQKLSLLTETFSTTVSSGTITFTPITPFYAIIGVTVSENYSVSVNDFGGPGSTTLSGSYEHPLWNVCMLGPNPTSGNAYRNYPYIYTWYPGNGASPTIFLDGGSGGFFNGKTITITYAAIDPSTNAFSRINVTTTRVPITALGLGREAQLGDGPEYTGFEDQQYIYPPFFGVGGPNFDLGTSGVLPQILIETQGMSIYPSGDADFSDMIEDTFCSGISQSAIAPTAGSVSSIHHGLNCFDFPGAVQKQYSEVSGSANSQTFHLPNALGNILFAFVRYDGSATVPTIADSASNTWHLVSNTPPAGGSQGQGIWYAHVTNTPATNTVTITGSGNDTQLFVAELGGVDTFDTSTATSGSGGTPSGTITTSGVAGRGELLISVLNTVSGGAAAFETSVHWNVMAGSYSANLAATMQRTVYNPGTYKITSGGVAVGNWTLCILAFSLSVPPPFVQPLGYILDPVSLEYARLQSRANGLFGSAKLDSQRKASDWMEDWFTAANVWPLWSGFQLKFIPKSEVSAAGNGAVYVALQAGASIPVLTQADFVASKGQDPLEIDRVAQVDTPNLIQVQYPLRANNYNDTLASQAESSNLAIRGVRKDAPKVMDCIYDSTVAQMVLNLMANAQNFQRNTYKFTLNAKWILTEAGDVLRIPVAMLLQPSQANNQLETIPVRITSVEEDENWNLSCEAEDYIYGVHAPQPTIITEPNPYQSPVGYVPALVNPPVIFEPVAGLTPNQSGFFLWLIVSCPDANYGGAQVYASFDNAQTYTLLGSTAGQGTTGVLTATWPSSTDPDSTNSLSVNLSESFGTLPNYTSANKDNLLYPYLVSGGGGSPIPYELTCFSLANLTGANQYTIPASDQIRRDVFGAPNEPGAPNGFGTGVAHPVGTAHTILGITSGTGGQMLVHDTAHGYVTGQTLFIPSGVTGVGGIGAYLNGKYWQITVADADHYLLNGTSFAVVTFDEQHTIPGSPYQVTVANTTSFIDDGVFYVATGQQLTKVASSPTQGQYTVTSGGLYTFAAADTGQVVEINYTSTASYTSGGTIKALPRFAFVDPNEVGMLKLILTQAQMSQPIHFKLAAFNSQAGGFQDIQQVVDYIYTPEGIGQDTGVPADMDKSVTSVVGGVSTDDGTLTLFTCGWPNSYSPSAPPNLASVTKISVDIGAVNEQIAYVRTLSSAITIGATSMTVLSSTGFQVGNLVQINAEVILIDSISGTTWGISRAQKGSTASAHTLASGVYLINDFITEELIYAPGQVLSILGAGQLPYQYGDVLNPMRRWPLPGIRILWLGVTPVNDFGSAVNDAIFPYITFTSDGTSNFTPGLRTLNGGSLTLQTPGAQGPNAATLFVGTNVTNTQTAVVTARPWYFGATVLTAPTTTGIGITINRNGTPFTTLSIPAGTTTSSLISGADLDLVNAGDVFTVDITQVGDVTSPGSGLIVTIQY